jgi:putative thioredoxin
VTNAPIPQSSLRGAVDLSSLVNPGAGAGAAARPASTAAKSELITSATDASFTSVLELSNSVPVIVEIYGSGIEPVLGRMIEEYAGKLALVTVDGSTNPQLVQAFQVEQVPTVAAVIGGRPVQLYVGEYPDAEVRQVFDRVLELAAQNGVTGTVAVPAAVEGSVAEPVEEPLPPHHQEAFDAISSGDYATAIAEYKTAIAQNPRDALAVAGLAQVSLLQRLDGVASDDIHAAAVAAPASVEAVLALADFELSSGDAGPALDRLLDLFPTLDATDKNTVRTRLLDYFEILGTDAPLVVAARRRLTGLLY